jgi:hypothetical protein
MQINNFLIGSDIEVFLRDRSSLKLISAAGDINSSFLPLVPGTKAKPYYIDEDKKFAIETDNVSVEFLVPPTTNEDEFVKNIQYMMEYISNSIPAYLEPLAIASGEFDSDQLLTAQALTFGCDKDLNAWTGKYNRSPDTLTNLRSNGFHIHIGYDDPNTETSFELIKALDLFIGLDSLLMDDDINRRTLYGKAGACRLKPYGVEYRVLSSKLISNPDHIRTVFRKTLQAIDFINSGKRVEEEHGKQIVKAINTNNVEKIKELCVEL